MTRQEQTPFLAVAELFLLCFKLNNGRDSVTLEWRIPFSSTSLKKTKQCRKGMHFKKIGCIPVGASFNTVALHVVTGILQLV